MFLGHFCHGDAELHAKVQSHLRAEEAFDPDALYAEESYTSRGTRWERSAASANAPPREVVYLGQSGAPPDQQLAIGDSMISFVAASSCVHAASGDASSFA